MPRFDRGGVLKYPNALSGSWGTGSGGSIGEDNPPSSIVEALDKGEDGGDDARRGAGARMPSCTNARGGETGDLGEDVFSEPTR